jgi:hypothetical protein
MTTENVDAVVLFDAVLEKVAEDFSQGLQQNVKITRINSIAQIAWIESWKSINVRKPPNGGWDWIDKYRDYKRKEPRYLLDFAIWESDILCGLAICSRSKRGEVISIHCIEGSPDDNHPLRGLIFKIIDLVCLEYAVSKKTVKTIQIRDPVERLITFYEEHGYKLQRKWLSGSRYCEKGVK